jgi:hypothetical protein
MLQLINLVTKEVLDVDEFDVDIILNPDKYINLLRKQGYDKATIDSNLILEGYVRTCFITSKGKDVSGLSILKREWVYYTPAGKVLYV